MRKTKETFQLPHYPINYDSTNQFNLLREAKWSSNLSSHIHPSTLTLSCSAYTPCNFQPMFPPHHSLLLPSRICLDHAEYENFHPLHSLARTRPSKAYLNDETLPQSQSSSSRSDDKNNNNNQQEQEEGVSCCACHKPLTLIGVQSTTLCYICNKFASTYFCAPCSNGLINFFDRRCSELPKEIHYPYHPHPLTMRIRKNCFCCVCGKSCRAAFNYGCDDCSFIVDIKCLLQEKKKYDGPITSVRKFMGLVYDL